MNATPAQAVPAPPSLITALRSGFDAISNHIGLILFPLGLDLFLWMGPHLRLETLIKAVVRQLDFLPGAENPAASQSVQLTQELWLMVAERLNLFSLLRTYPVGIPSLMVTRQPVEMPLGAPILWDMASLGAVLGLWLVLTIAGLLVGAFYFTVVAQASLNGKVDLRQAYHQWRWAAGQVLLLSIFITGLLAAIAIPGSCFISVVSLGGIPLGQLSLLLLGGVLLWTLFPLFFSAHGIFTFQHKMWASVQQGSRLTRLTLAKTSLMILIFLMISQGLDVLWMVPPEASWLSLLGIAGHAFITTSLLAASFIYYRDAYRWVQRKIQQALLVERSRNLHERIS